MQGRRVRVSFVSSGMILRRRRGQPGASGQWNNRGSFAGVCRLACICPKSFPYIDCVRFGRTLRFSNIDSGRYNHYTTARIFALGTTAVMFFYFACFFTMAREFQDGWVRTGSGLEGLGLLLAAFMMIPILSCYSCLLKADGCEQPTSAKGAAFFRVPDDVKDALNLIRDSAT